VARRHPPAADPRRLLRERAAGVLRPLPAAARGSEPDLHVLRVAARRLRIALALLARKPAGRRARRIRRTLRAVLRASGPGRDHDVMAALLARHAADAGCDASGLARRLAAARRRGRRRLAGGLRRVDAARLRLRLARLARNPARGPDARRRVGYALDRQRRAVERALVALGRRADAERLHALRVGCRRLRYTVELRDALARRASAAPERLRAFQDRLGAMHDAYLLARWLAVQARRADGAERHCARALHVAVSRALRAAHADWLALRPRQALRAVWDPAATEEA
jgi:CHAD domain-containing protein